MRNNWTREELILAFNLYCKLPYGNFNTHSKEVIELANLIGRSPGAVAFKLVNFVSLDPNQKLIGRKGAKNSSKLDKEIFKEFTENFDQCFLESEKLLESKTGIRIENIGIKNMPITIMNENQSNLSSAEVENILDKNKKGTTQQRIVNERVNQDYFRKIVLSNYANRCAVTDIAIPDLLIASHIIPWAKNTKNRLNPTNGICLSATFDKAFDRGLITIDEGYSIIYSRYLKKFSTEDFYKKEFVKYENAKIILPIKFLPSQEFLQYHRDEIFKG